MSFIFKGATKEEVETKAADMRKGIETNGRFDYLLDVRLVSAGVDTYWQATLLIFFKKYI